jgi:hypothetical protein
MCCSLGLEFSTIWIALLMTEIRAHAKIHRYTLQRPHKTVDHRLLSTASMRRRDSLGTARLRPGLRYGDVWERGDVDAIVAMLTDGATIAKP